MAYRDYHIHTTFSDGENSVEEMVLAAIDLGMPEIGISDHSYTSFEQSYCMKKGARAEYVSTVRAVAEKYKDKIKVLCGIEQDYYSDFPADGCDYVIGSVHFLKKGGEYVEIDGSPENFARSVEKFYSGDAIALCRDYYATVSDVVRKTGADIIGHFDLVKKFNKGGVFFDESDARYVSAWKGAVDSLVLSGKPFEINTGGISRGYRDEPYPSDAICRYIKEKGGRFIASSDSHSTKNICFGFDTVTHSLSSLGI